MTQRKQLYADRLDSLSDLQAALDVVCESIVNAVREHHPDFRLKLNLSADTESILLEIISANTDGHSAG